MVSTFAMEVDISHILEANMRFLAAPVVTTHFPDIRSIQKKKITTAASQLSALFFHKKYRVI